MDDLNPNQNGEIVDDADNTANGESSLPEWARVGDPVDNSGAANDTDPSANTLTLDVDPINDKPAISGSPAIAATEQAAILVNGTMTLSDVDLDARNGGDGDYAGLLFGIGQGVPNANDVFSFDTAGASFTVTAPISRPVVSSSRRSMS
jgi:hypothetical protein